jgi:hypothetical protein
MSLQIHAPLPIGLTAAVAPHPERPGASASNDLGAGSSSPSPSPPLPAPSRQHLSATRMAGCEGGGAAKETRMEAVMPSATPRPAANGEKSSKTCSVS